MKRTSSGPVDHLRRVQRAVAESVAALAELSPVRALMALVVTLGFGTSAAVAMASVGTPATYQERQVALERPTPTVSRDTDRPEVTDSDPAAPEVSASEQAEPKAPPLRSPEAQQPERSVAPGDEQSAPGQGIATETPDEPLPSSPSSSGSAGSSEPSAPGKDSSGSSKDQSPPQTVLSEWFPDGDEAVFSFMAGEEATYECSLDGAPYSPCDSPASYEDLRPGWHTFVVRAVDEAGNADSTPAMIRWHANAGSAEARGSS